MKKDIQLSIILPTYNEVQNIAPVVESILKTMDGVAVRYEIIFVDDSTDDTPCLLYTSPSPRDKRQSRMPSSA